MTPKCTAEKNASKQTAAIHRMPNDLSPEQLADLLRLTGFQSDALFWQWQRNSGVVSFYTTEEQPEPARYDFLAQAISSLISLGKKDSESTGSVTWKEELEIPHSGGPSEWANLCILLFLTPDGHPDRAVGTLHDITRWKTIQRELENKLDFINTLLDALVSPVFYKDSELVYRHCNKAFEAYLGKSREDILDKTVYDLSPPHLAEIYHQADLTLLEGRKPQIYEAQVRAADGHEHHVIFNKSPVFNNEGDITGMIGIINDISERVQMENRLRRIMGIKDAIVEINRAVMDVVTVEHLYGVVLKSVVAAMESADAGSILLFEPSGDLKLVAANGIFEQIKSPEPIAPQSCAAWNAMEGNPEKCFYIPDITEFSISKGFQPNEILAANHIRSMLGAPILNQGNLMGFITVGSQTVAAYDETDLFVMEYIRNQVNQVISKQALYEKNILLARHDDLTGLYNRRHFVELFETAKKRAQRYGESFHVVAIDLDHFKSINDRHGHQVGDAVLIDFARRLTRSVRESDIIARYGGDEFILVLFNTDTDALTEKLETLRSQMLETPIDARGVALTYSFSYGISEFPLEGTELDSLARLADYYMYVYKKYGKDDSGQSS